MTDKHALAFVTLRTEEKFETGQGFGLIIRLIGKSKREKNLMVRLIGSMTLTLIFLFTLSVYGVFGSQFLMKQKI